MSLDPRASCLLALADPKTSSDPLTDPSYVLCFWHTQSTPPPPPRPPIRSALCCPRCCADYWDLKQLAATLTLLDPVAAKFLIKFVLAYPPDAKGRCAWLELDIDPVFGSLCVMRPATCQCTCPSGCSACSHGVFPCSACSHAHPCAKLRCCGHISPSASATRSPTASTFSAADSLGHGTASTLSRSSRSRGPTSLPLATVPFSPRPWATGRCWPGCGCSSPTGSPDRLAKLGEPCIADYGAFAGDFLECVPTYVNAVATLQAANAWLSEELAAIELSVGGGGASSSSVVASLRSDAECIKEAMLRRLYRSSGYFATMNASNVTTEIRTIVDLQACGRWIGRAGLGDERSGQMAAFFHRELDRPALGWPIALSRSDGLKYIDRSDHGTTGSHASWPPLAFEALAELVGNFTSAMPFFLRAAPSARQGPFGQAQGVSLSPTQNDVSAFKAEPGATRYVAIAGASWAEATIRTIFGWRPSFGGEAEPLWRASELRGVAATLSGLRLPNGTVGTLVSGPSGVSMRQH